MTSPSVKAYRWQQKLINLDNVHILLQSLVVYNEFSQCDFGTYIGYMNFLYFSVLYCLYRRFCIWMLLTNTIIVGPPRMSQVSFLTELIYLNLPNLNHSFACGLMFFYFILLLLILMPDKYITPQLVITAAVVKMAPLKKFSKFVYNAHYLTTTGNDTYLGSISGTFPRCCLLPVLSVVVVLGNLTHWGRVTHMCVSRLNIFGSDNGLSPGRRQAIILTNAGILLIGLLGTNFGEILIAIWIFSFKKMHLSSGKWRPFCLDLNVLTHWPLPNSCYWLISSASWVSWASLMIYQHYFM